MSVFHSVNVALCFGRCFFLYPISKVCMSVFMSFHEWIPLIVHYLKCKSGLTSVKRSVQLRDDTDSPW